MTNENAGKFASWRSIDLQIERRDVEIVLATSNNPDAVRPGCMKRIDAIDAELARRAQLPNPAWYKRLYAQFNRSYEIRLFSFR